MAPLLHVRHERNHMATTFEFTISCDSSCSALADRVLDQAHALVSRLEDELSEFRERSPVYRLNHAALGERIHFSEAGIDLLERAFEIRNETSGSFDCLAKSEGVARGKAGIAWDRERREVWKTMEGAWLGFGAIGKGYALDCVRRLLEQHGFGDFLLCAGGSSIVLSGFAAPGDPWKWAWSWKKNVEGRPVGIPFSHFSGSAIAIGVSGTQEKGRHLLDSRTNGPADRGITSALVAHSSAMEADALSTALFVAGWEEAHELANRRTSVPALAALTDDQSFLWNGSFQRAWGALAGFCAVTLAHLLLSAHACAEDSIDLGALGADAFTPYVQERNPAWALLPIFAIGMVILHLKKSRRNHR